MIIVSYLFQFCIANHWETKNESAEQVKRVEKEGIRKRRNSKENLILQLHLSWGKF